jgi:hypothetical protein
MIKLVTIAFLCFCVLFSGCNSKGLTRSKAAEIISKTFPRPVTSNFAVGRSDAGAGTMEQFLKTSAGRMRKLEQDDGLLSLTWEGVTRNALGMTMAIVRVDLTDKGKSYIVGQNNPQANGGYVAIKMCEQQFNEITGITMADRNTARVDYTWKLGELTPFAKSQNEVLGKAAFSCASFQPVGDSLAMTLYDDGWRIAR